MTSRSLPGDADRTAIPFAVWQRRLVDTTRRNTLLYFRDLKKGTLDLSGAPADAIRRLLSGEAIALTSLAPNQTSDNVGGRAVTLHRRAGVNHDEKGIDTLHVAFGLASWPIAGGGASPAAAVLLLPAVIDLRGRDGRRAQIRATGDLTVNGALTHMLSEVHGIRLTSEDIFPEAEEPTAPAAAFERLALAAADLPGFIVAPRIVVGNFAFQKLAMLEDMRANTDAMARHAVIAALTGDSDARAKTLATRQPINVAAFDAVRPEDEFLVLDADSSQQRVVAAVASGQSGVIQGPPGTGKSQTIVNLIATLAARGQRVLFVAEKRAALDVVARRLDRLGLAALTLDLHGADLTRKQHMAKVASALAAVRQTSAVDASELHASLAKSRSALADHARRVNAPRSPSGLSEYALAGRLLGSDPESRIGLRWRGADLDRLTAPAAERVRLALAEASARAELITRRHPSGWARAQLEDGRMAEQAVDAAARLARERLPTLTATLERLALDAGLNLKASLGSAEGALSVMLRVQRMTALYYPSVFALDFKQLIPALQPGSALARHVWSSLTSAAYRAARRSLLALRRSGTVSAADLLMEAQQVAIALREWRAVAEPGRQPVVSDALGAAQDAYTHVRSDLAILGLALGADVVRTWQDEPIPQLRERLAALVTEANVAYAIPRVRELERAIRLAGAGAFLDEIRAGVSDPATWIARFDYAWHASCHERVLAEDRHIAGFMPIAHDRLIAEFRELDRLHLSMSAARTRRAHAERAIAVMNAHPDQTANVRREAEKKARHKPLRRLFAEAPEVLTALFPCFMASPLSVSQLLAGDRPYFDVVVFDEASQVLPEDAVCAILRARNVVVAGDKHQLPPTRFFVGGNEDDDQAEEETNTVEGFESLLDEMSAFLEPWMLEWHYRSRDERLIAFSNRNIYQNRLVTFPSPRGGAALRHVLVQAVVSSEDGSGPAASENTSMQEARRVVELILEHAQALPNETLGVIALGITHARRIEELLDAALEARPELSDFFEESRPEKFFVKNLERVQGDERDAIILSVGYAKDAGGKLPYRFGPLIQEGGERRLNVAVTRARSRMTLVSSFDHTDMDPDRSRSRGVELLRAYLLYASDQSGGAADGHSGRSADGVADDVIDALRRRGLTVVAGLGTAQDPIDLAVGDARNTGEFTLALETDGADYARLPTVRDRDRLRAQQLESLGWRYRRVWSPAWLADRERQADAARDLAQSAPGNEKPVVDESGDGSDNGSVEVPAVIGPDATEDLNAFGFPRRGAIELYSLGELTDYVRVMMKTGELRTDADWANALMRSLGFRRRGAKILKACLEAVAAARR